jgi:hypothetical protein
VNYLRYSNFWVATIMMAASVVCVSGCVSAAKAKADARAAYNAGQQDAMARMSQVEKLNITVVGPVRNSVVAWKEDLTLANALLAAEYLSNTDPRQILIVRKGIAIPVDPNQLLSGRDVPLQPGDVIHLQP